MIVIVRPSKQAPKYMQPNPKIAMTAPSGISISFSFILFVNPFL